MVTTDIDYAVHAADVQLCAVEAGFAAAEARLHLFEAAMTNIKKLAREAGISVPERNIETTTLVRNLSRGQFAMHMNVSVRTVDKHRKMMREMVHFHYDGTRVIFHLPEAETFVRQLSRSVTHPADIEILAIDEVNRRRAKAALKNARGQ